MLLLIVGGAAACSSGGGSSKPLTKSELIALGDKVCSQSGKKIDGISSPSGQVTDETPPAQVRKWAKPYAALADILDQEALALGALTPPSADSASYTKVVSDLRIQAEYAKQAAAAAKAGNAIAVQKALASQKSSNADSEEFLTGYGFKVCGT
ncbi:MAG: hypothetical protein JWL73_3604 [Actinomycetia bacterium]|nr:hypothetical protein [Actinomycetes bacterium]